MIWPDAQTSATNAGTEPSEKEMGDKREPTSPSGGTAATGEDEWDGASAPGLESRGPCLAPQDQQHQHRGEQQEQLDER